MDASDVIISGLESQISTLKARLDETERRLKASEDREAQALAGQKLAISAAAAGVLHKAIPDAVNRALSVGTWKDVKGKLVRHTADGFPDFFTDGSYVTADSIIDSFREEAPFYWPDSNSQSPPAGRRPLLAELNGEPNPYDPKTRNITKQVKLWETNPELAFDLAKAAGKPVLPGLKVGERPAPK